MITNQTRNFSIFFQKISGPTALNGNEIKFFASFPHAHTAGKGIVTTQVRKGEEIKEIFRDDSYDFDYQVNSFVLSNDIILSATRSRMVELPDGRMPL